MQVWSTNNSEIVTYSNNNKKLSKLYPICWCFSWTNLNHPTVETHPPGSAMRSGAYWFCSPRLIPPNAIGCHPIEMSIGISMGFFKKALGQKNHRKMVPFFWFFVFLWIFSAWQKWCSLHFLTSSMSVWGSGFAHTESTSGLAVRHATSTPKHTPCEVLCRVSKFFQRLCFYQATVALWTLLAVRLPAHVVVAALAPSRMIAKLMTYLHNSRLWGFSRIKMRFWDAWCILTLKILRTQLIYLKKNCSEAILMRGFQRWTLESPQHPTVLGKGDWHHSWSRSLGLGGQANFQAPWCLQGMPWLLFSHSLFDEKKSVSCWVVGSMAEVLAWKAESSKLGFEETKCII